MAEIIIRDYEDDFWGDVNCIGMGLNHSSIIVPLIEQAVTNGEKEITVNINTVGGSVFCSLAIKTALQRAKEQGVKIITVNEGVCASAGTQIFMEGDERICYTSLFMIHNPSLFIFGNMTEADLEREKNALKIVKDTILLTYKATGLDDVTLTQMLDAETWLTPALCYSLGFATEDKSTVENKADVLESSIKALDKASPENRIYANKFFNSIKNNKMNVQEVLKNQNETQARTNTLLEDLGKFFKNLVAPKNEGEEPVNDDSDLADGGKIYYMGVLGVGTEVFTDEAMTEHPAAGDHDLVDGNFITVDDGGIVTVMDKKEDPATDDSADVENLKNEIETLKAENAKLVEATNSLTASLNAANEGLDKIKNIKSTYEPDARQQEIDRKLKLENNDNKTMADITARREERKQLNNKK